MNKTGWILVGEGTPRIQRQQYTTLNFRLTTQVDTSNDNPHSGEGLGESLSACLRDVCG